MIYEKDQIYSIKDIIQHYFADNECDVRNNIYLKIIKETVRKLEELKISYKSVVLEDVKIKYNGMQIVSHKPTAMIWTFDSTPALHHTFCVMI